LTRLYCTRGIGSSLNLLRGLHRCNFCWRTFFSLTLSLQREVEEENFLSSWFHLHDSGPSCSLSCLFSWQRGPGFNLLRGLRRCKFVVGLWAAAGEPPRSGDKPRPCPEDSNLLPHRQSQRWTPKMILPTACARAILGLRSADHSLDSERLYERTERVLT
jgi:hypothetical protein